LKYDIKFTKALRQGLIIKRPNRFTAVVKSNKRLYKCFCPVASIRNIPTLVNKKCLISKAEKKDPKRKTDYTVEAIQLNNIWHGINQIKINAYIASLINKSRLSMFPKDEVLGNNYKVHKSNIDILTKKALVEVKCFLDALPEAPSLITKQLQKGYEKRFLLQLKALRSTKLMLRKVVLFVFFYNAENIEILYENKWSAGLSRNLKKAKDNNLEVWQINLKINPEGLKVISARRAFVCPKIL